MMAGSWPEIIHPPPPSHLKHNTITTTNTTTTTWWPNTTTTTTTRKRERTTTTTTTWSNEENKLFEDALAEFDKDVPHRWERVAALVPGKSVQQVVEHYRELEEDVGRIEAGCCSPEYDYEYDVDCYDVDSPSCSSSPFLLVEESEFDQCEHSGRGGKKRGGGGRGMSCGEHERKKGIPWTEEEHRLFLLGLNKHGKGDWRSISRNFVITRTSTQVASHAQKYFIRLNSPGKDKRRSSIHDITTANLPADTGPPGPISGQFSAAITTATAQAAQNDHFLQKQQAEMLALRGENEITASSKIMQNCHPPWFFV